MKFPVQMGQLEKTNQKNLEQGALLQHSQLSWAFGHMSMLLAPNKLASIFHLLSPFSFSCFYYPFLSSVT